ncbi:MAG: single-stranded DNA-binding protein [Burkholderiales bacterium]|nr:single-stranded DNA-binding protein [Burkholderiales bacterium]
MKKIIITGNLGRDPEKRSDSTGNQFATFSVAIPVGTKQNPKTDWVDVSCGGKLADVVCTYLKKGSKVLVSGFPTVNAYINKENTAVGVLRIYADDIEFLSPKSETEAHNSDYNSEVHTLPPINPSPTTLESDNIPF